METFLPGRGQVSCDRVADIAPLHPRTRPEKPKGKRLEIIARPISVPVESISGESFEVLAFMHRGASLTRSCI